MAKTFKRFMVLGLAVCVAAICGIFAAACNKEPEKTDEPESYTVSFNMQNHGAAPSAQSVEKGGYATKPENDPTEIGWKFEGWYKEAAGENVFIFNQEVINADTTVYAKWSELTEEDNPVAPTEFSSIEHIYMSGYEGQVAEGSTGNVAYSSDNVWEYTPWGATEATTMYYNEVTFTGAVKLMWHLNGCVAGTQYKVDIRVGDDFEQDSEIRSTYNMWVGQDNDYSQMWDRRFGLIGLQITFEEDDLTPPILQIILENPANEEVTLRIICAVGDSH